MDFFLRKIVGDQAFAGVLVGDKEVVAGRAGPGGIDFDGVGDDGDNRDSLPTRKLAIDHVRVKRVGVDYHVRLELIQQIGDCVFGLPDEGQRFREVLSVGGAIHPGPDFRRVGGDLTVGFAKEGIDAWVAEVAWVGDQNFSISLQRFGKVAGRTVVPVAKTCGEN